LYGLLTHLLNDDARSQAHAPAALWAAGCVVVTALGLRRARAAFDAGDDLCGFTLAGLLAGLVSPISWIHHLVWFVPACVILGDVAVRRRSWPFAGATAALYGVASSSLVVLNQHRGGHHYQGGLVGLLAENTFAIAALIVLAALPTRPHEQNLAWVTGLPQTRPRRRRRRAVARDDRPAAMVRAGLQCRAR
jgi:alpha-1,2-mannosyltransferase